MEPFCTHPDVFAVQPVRNPDDADMFDQAVCHLTYQTPVNGGATRQASVRAGLEALAEHAPDIVLIHDAARAFVTDQVISRAIDAALITGAAIPVVPVTDTVKLVDASGAIEATPDRARLRIAQTPQAFRFDVILEAHRRAAREGRDDFTDDAAIAEWAGLTVTTFEGDAANMKLTTPEDFAREEARLGAMLGDIRMGTGYDVHAFGDGDHLMLCGVRVPFNRGFLAHSDGDVGLHAIVDAILGALADGDIGSHFPPSDPKWKGAASDQFLEIRRRSRRQAWRSYRKSRSDDDLRSAENRPAARGHASPHRRDHRPAPIPRGGEGNDQRAAGIYRPPGRDRRDRRRDDPAALGHDWREQLSMSGSATRALSRSLLDLCRMRKLTIATAESCTGGLVAAALTDIPGSSDVVDRGFITYSNEAKHAMLGVETSTLETFGAVSKETAVAMAFGALENADVDLAVSITGIAGPGGATPGKPVGLVHHRCGSP